MLLLLIIIMGHECILETVWEDQKEGRGRKGY
jgi:hypothetical protein